MIPPAPERKRPVHHRAILPVVRQSFPCLLPRRAHESISTDDGMRWGDLHQAAGCSMQTVSRALRAVDVDPSLGSGSAANESL